MERGIRWKTNLAILAALVLLNLAQLFLLPLVLLAHSPWWALILPLVVLSVTPLWALIHEAIHNNLHPDTAINQRLGRLLGVAFGSPFQLLRLGHLMHHRFNRTELNRPEVTSRRTVMEWIKHYVMLLGGLWVGEFVASALAVLPNRLYKPLIVLGFGDETPDGKSMWDAARRQLLEEPGRRRMRFDGAVICAVYGLAFVAYGSLWWVLALALYGRALMISLFDNAYHYAGPLDDVMSGQNLALPRWAERWFLNYNYHEVHHRRPSVPWSGLPDQFARSQARFADRFIPATLRQFRGPIPEARLPRRDQG